MFILGKLESFDVPFDVDDGWWCDSSGNGGGLGGGWVVGYPELERYLIDQAINQ